PPNGCSRPRTVMASLSEARPKPKNPAERHTMGENIIVYSKREIRHRASTYQILKQLCHYQIVAKLTDETDALALVKSLGYQQAPVVMAGNEHWSGFRPDRIKAVVTAA